MGAKVSPEHDPRVLEEAAGWMPLTGECLVRLAGPAHRDALQRVVSQDVVAVPEGGSALALLLAPKGQFQAIMAVFPGSEESWLLTPPGRAAELARRLSRYLGLSRCTAERVPAAGALALLGARAFEAASAAGADAEALRRGGRCDADGLAWFGRTLLGVPGAIAVAREASARSPLEKRLAAAGLAGVSEEAVELARMRVGWPAWGAELTETVLPPEVGIEAETVSYSKGCYIGQETIARLKTYGHPNRTLVGLRQTGDGDAPSLPAPLVAAGQEKVRGELTSWGRHPEIGGVGLAIVRRELAAPGTALAGAGRTFEVASFPLW